MPEYPAPGGPLFLSVQRLGLKKLIPTAPFYGRSLNVSRRGNMGRPLTAHGAALKWDAGGL
jgi:hypothetical protein